MFQTERLLKRPRTSSVTLFMKQIVRRAIRKQFCLWMSSMAMWRSTYILDFASWTYPLACDSLRRQPSYVRQAIRVKMFNRSSNWSLPNRRLFSEVLSFASYLPHWAGLMEARSWEATGSRQRKSLEQETPERTYKVKPGTARPSDFRPLGNSLSMWHESFKI